MMKYVFTFLCFPTFYLYIFIRFCVYCVFSYFCVYLFICLRVHLFTCLLVYIFLHFFVAVCLLGSCPSPFLFVWGGGEDWRMTWAMRSGKKGLQ